MQAVATCEHVDEREGAAIDLAIVNLGAKSVEADAILISIVPHTVASYVSDDLDQLLVGQGAHGRVVVSAQRRQCSFVVTLRDDVPFRVFEVAAAFVNIRNELSSLVDNTVGVDDAGDQVEQLERRRLGQLGSSFGFSRASFVALAIVNGGFAVYITRVSFSSSLFYILVFRRGW